MIVTKTLNILNKSCSRTVFLLGNRVVTDGRTVDTLSDNEIGQFKELMGRCRNVTFKTSWIDYIKNGVEKALEQLNMVNYYPYEDRGWTFTENETSYVVDIFLDNYDIEEFLCYEIPKSEISKTELVMYADEEK